MQRVAEENSYEALLEKIEIIKNKIDETK